MLRQFTSPQSPADYTPGPSAGPSAEPALAYASDITMNNGPGPSTQPWRIPEPEYTPEVAMDDESETELESSSDSDLESTSEPEPESESTPEAAMNDEPEPSNEPTPEAAMNDQPEPSNEPPHAPPSPNQVPVRGPATDSEYNKWTFSEPDARLFTLDDQDLSTRLPLDNGRHPNMTPGTADLGKLERFPPELRDEIISLLDIGAMTTFRRVNKCARDRVDSYTPYARLFKECPDILRAIIATEAPWTARTVFEALKEDKCSKCSGFGSLFHLISATRICVPCLRTVKHLHPVTEQQIRNGIYSRGRDDLSTLPSILSLPGTWGPANVAVAQRERLWHLPEVQNTAPGLVLIGQFKAPEELLARNRVVYYKRFMTVISAPVLKRGSAAPVDWGVFCEGCRSKENLAISRYWATKYTREHFDRHVMRHGGLTEEDDARFEHTVDALAVVPETAPEDPDDIEAGATQLKDKEMLKMPGSNLWMWNRGPAPPKPGDRRAKRAHKKKKPPVKTARAFHKDGIISAAALRVALDFSTMQPGDGRELDPFRMYPPFMRERLRAAMPGAAGGNARSPWRRRVGPLGSQQPIHWFADDPLSQWGAVRMRRELGPRETEMPSHGLMPVTVAPTRRNGQLVVIDGVLLNTPDEYRVTRTWSPPLPREAERPDGLIDGLMEDPPVWGPTRSWTPPVRHGLPEVMDEFISTSPPVWGSSRSRPPPVRHGLSEVMDEFISTMQHDPAF